MSYWVGRFIHTDDGEHGRVLDRKVLRRLSKRQLVELIEAKDVELVAWDDGGRLELIAEEYLADEGTHVSLSASEEAARHPRRPRTLFPAAVLVSCLALCAGGLVLARLHAQASRPTVIPPHRQDGATFGHGTAQSPSPAQSLILAPYPFPTVTRMSPSPVAVPSMTASLSPSPTVVTTTTSVPSPYPTSSPSGLPTPTPSVTSSPSPSPPPSSPPPTTPAPTPDPG
jgi:hypothetical protein